VISLPCIKSCLIFQNFNVFKRVMKKILGDVLVELSMTSLKYMLIGFGKDLFHTHKVSSHGVGASENSLEIASSCRYSLRPIIQSLSKKLGGMGIAFCFNLGVSPSSIRRKKLLFHAQGRDKGRLVMVNKKC
jgi:hypothetical protein